MLTMSDKIRLNVNIINIRFKYLDTDTVSDVEHSDSYRLNHSKQIRSRIQSENINTIVIPITERAIYEDYYTGNVNIALAPRHPCMHASIWNDWGSQRRVPGGLLWHRPRWPPTRQRDGEAKAYWLRVACAVAVCVPARHGSRVPAAAMRGARWPCACMHVYRRPVPCACLPLPGLAHVSRGRMRRSRRARACGFAPSPPHSSRDIPQSPMSIVWPVTIYIVMMIVTPAGSLARAPFELWRDDSLCPFPWPSCWLSSPLSPFYSSLILKWKNSRWYFSHPRRRLAMVSVGNNIVWGSLKGKKFLDSAYFIYGLVPQFPCHVISGLVPQGRSVISMQISQKKTSKGILLLQNTVWET